MRRFTNLPLLGIQAFLGVIIMGTNRPWSTGWVAIYVVFSLALNVVLTVLFDQHRRGRGGSSSTSGP